MQREELSPWTKHAATCAGNDQPAWKKTCTCGLDAAEERVKRKRAELLRLIGEDGP
ncbi:MAG: hypothetical protein Q8P41_09895 [Pseudomonadota bacterium]|nr:hypothetical protein [Pseudomonadota bacterium]